MDDLCPLCLKMGANRKIKAIQINLEEALWMCENEECPWPFFGQDDPTFFPRKVGEKWAYEWQTYRRVKERIGSIPISIELSLYTPPVTPSGDASAKDSLHLETAKNTLESSNNTDIFSSNSSPSDSYAPRSLAESCLSSHEKSITAKDLKCAKIVPLQYKKDCQIVAEMPSAVPSIFDIDGDEFLTNKISVKLPSDLGSSDLPDNAVLKKKKSEAAIKRIETVLSTLPKSHIEKSHEISEKSIDLIENIESAAKGIKIARGPHIRSIARANIDLQRFDQLNIVKIKEPETLEKLECPSTSPKQKSHEDIADRFLSPTQCTTTIKVDGIPPITLSYDLTDLCEKADKNIAKNLLATSTPIPPKKSTTILQDNDHDKETAEKPKKLSRQSVKRRNCSNGKAFEKFSFSKLKRDVKGSTAIKIEPTKLEEIINPNQSCDGQYENTPTKDILASGIAETTSGCEAVSQHIEMKSINLETKCSVVTESPAVDSLNLSCLIDDMLLNECQNATQNLNDDWLESFFNENT